MCPGVRPEAGLGCLAHPLGGAVCRRHAQYPAFAPNTLFLLPVLQKWQLFLFFSFVAFGPEFAPTVHAHSYF